MGMDLRPCMYQAGCTLANGGMERNMDMAHGSEAMDKCGEVAMSMTPNAAHMK